MNLMVDSSYKQKITVELETAETARAQGNEGMARVCARRAAGIMAREYFSHRETPIVSANAYELLGILENLAEVPENVRVSAQRLRIRVNEQFELSEPVDLIAEARNLIDALENIIKGMS